jgi:ABC-2 type transport system permease protein
MAKNNYNNLVREIALTDLKLKYQGSVLGYFWSLLKPLLLFAVMFLVFTKFFKLGTSIPYYPVYLLLGIVIWTFFAEVTSICMGSIVSKGPLIRKVYFPRILLVFSNSLTSFITFLLNLVAVFVFMFFMKVPITFNLLLFPVLIIELYIFALGVALILASLFVKYRDIAHIWEVFMQAFFYATPILYPLSFVPAPYNKIITLSPLAQIIQDSRFLLITNQTTRNVEVLGSALGWIPYVLPFIFLVFGYYLFDRMSAKFAEEV